MQSYYDITNPDAAYEWLYSVLDMKRGDFISDYVLGAKINDCLWVAEKSFSAAKSAEEYYRAHVESTEGFDFNFMAINRLVFLSKKLSSKETDDTIRKKLLIRVMDQYDNEDHGRILYLIQTAMYEKADRTETERKEILKK